MKRILIPLFALQLFVLVVQARSYSYSYGSTVSGDVRIQSLNNGSLYCDSMICPRGTYNCKVTKRNDPNDFQVIVRRRSCFDGNGSVLAEEVVNEPNPYNGSVNMVVTSGAGGSSIRNGGREMTPEEKRELKEELRRTREEIKQEQIQMQQEMAASMKELQEEMQQFYDGSFAANLNKQISSSIRNGFRF